MSTIALPPRAATPMNIATERTPSLSLPLRFFLMGIAGYLAAMAMVARHGGELATGATWTPHLLALVHLLALGSFVPIIIGASYQLVPVVLLARVWSEPLGKAGFWPYALGTAGMIWGFWNWHPVALATGATLVVVGLALFLFNVAASLLRGAEWSQVGGFFVASLGALVAAAALGATRVIGLLVPSLALDVPRLLPAHASLAALGGVTLLIYGVSYRLIPMFAVGHEHDRFGKAVLGLGGFGVAALALGNVGGLPALALAGAVAFGTATVLWALDAWQMFRSRARRRLDPGLSYVASAIAYLLVATALGLALAGGAVPAAIPVERWTLAYAAVGLVGWVGFSILGHLHKILPFLLWYHRYSHLVGTCKVPLIRELFDEPVAKVGFWSSHAGLVLLVAGVLPGIGWLASLGGALLAVGAAATAIMILQCLTR